MSNWAKLQEELTGLPVHKRARHGIHFDKGGGEIVANFSGAPCHYLEKGLWKPIDTTPILLPNGWYGCAHSKVRVHPDGRVRVTGSDYQQFTKLPSAKAGKLSGDRIIRTFPGGEQHLIITEKGFRQEIRVDKPTFPLEKFIVTRSGKLPSEFKESPLAAVDASDESYEFTGDVKAFGDWLDKAAYPVVIDPDFSSNSATGDVTLLDAALATYNYGTGNQICQTTGRALIRYVLSSIPSNAESSSASLKLIKVSGVVSSLAQTLTMYKIADANGDWIEGTKNKMTAGAGEPCWNAKEADGSGGVTTAWAGSAGLSTAGTDYVNTSLGSVGTNRVDAIGTEYTIAINASGLTVLNSWFGDATNNGFLLYGAYGYGHAGLGSSENTTEAYRPVLSITYTAATGGIPKHFMHYQRMRSL